MRKVVYKTEMNDYQAKSLRELRNHVEFFNSVYKRNDYDGDYVYRYVLRNGVFVRDDKFFVQIWIIRGKVRLYRVPAGLVTSVPNKNVKP